MKSSSLSEYGSSCALMEPGVLRNTIEYGHHIHNAYAQEGRIKVPTWLLARFGINIMPRDRLGSFFFSSLLF